MATAGSLLEVGGAWSTVFRLWARKLEGALGLNNGGGFSFAVDNSNPCSVAWTFGDSFTITDPSLIPTCLLAALVGLYGFRTISQHSNTRGHVVYAMSFLMFACMMTDAMFVHCFLTGQKTLLSYLVGLIDVGLTSSIGLSFLYNGLVDVGVMKENTLSSFVVMFGSYALIFCAWVYEFQHSIRDGFLILYLGIIMVGCGSYCITQVYSLYKMGRWEGSGWLGVAGLAGGVGVAAIFTNTWLCTNVSPYLSGEFVWFLLSDVAMWGILNYFLNHQVALTPTKEKDQVTYNKLTSQV